MLVYIVYIVYVLVILLQENNEPYRKVRDFNFIILLQSVWKNKDPPLIRTEINVGPLILIHVINLTCLLPCNVQGTWMKRTFFVF